MSNGQVDVNSNKHHEGNGKKRNEKWVMNRVRTAHLSRFLKTQDGKEFPDLRALHKVVERDCLPGCPYKTFVRTWNTIGILADIKLVNADPPPRKRGAPARTGDRTRWVARIVNEMQESLVRQGGFEPLLSEHSQRALDDILSGQNPNKRDPNETD